MEAKLNLTAVFEEVEEGGYIAYIEEIPGVNTQGETLDEARINLHEALELVTQAYRDLAEQEINGRKVIREKFLIAQ
jgi:predicted RNase H-like HicB family nuclease